MAQEYSRGSHPKLVVIREVWAHNLYAEFSLIGALLSRCSFISIDTEFPGYVFKSLLDLSTPHYTGKLQPSDQYRVLKSNVDALNLIQLGLTLADAYGNLPDFGGEYCYIWEFNFHDFDVARDIHAPESIQLLRQQGIDFERNRSYGIDSAEFIHLMMRSGLVCNHAVTWVTFHSAYDFGFLVKILTRRYLPESLGEFLWTLKRLFGNKVYDMKHMMRFCNGLYGGLEQVAKTLQVDRAVGMHHHAGSDSLLTWQSFRRMINLYFMDVGAAQQHAGVLYGLEIH